MNTDKKTQTVYTPFDLNSEIKFSLLGKKHENIYIFTPEELEALLQKERREAAEKAWVEAITFPPPYIGSTLHYDAPYEEYIRREQYLDQHYPLPQPPKQ